MKAIVTEKHLDAAIALRHKMHSMLSHECIAAQLCKEIYGDVFDGCASGVVCLLDGSDLKVKDEKFSNLISKFDLELYDSIRATLPLEVELPEPPAPKTK
jgi:hypothetical protein